MFLFKALSCLDFWRIEGHNILTSEEDDDSMGIVLSVLPGVAVRCFYVSLEGASFMSSTQDLNASGMNSSKTPLTLTMEEVEIIRSFVWQGCSDGELRFALSVCQALGLNPLLKHVVFIKGSGNSSGNIYTTRDGLLHMAHQSGQFNGMQSGVLYATNKEGERLRVNDRKMIEGAWCRVYRKDMTHPFEVDVNFEEYNRPRSPVWQQYPAAMIKKVAEHMALKLAFNVSGLASVEEIGIEERQLQEVRQSRESLDRLREKEKEFQVSMKVMIDTIRQLQSRYQLSREEIQRVTRRETLKGLTLKELESVVLLLNEYCMGLPQEQSCQPAPQEKDPVRDSSELNAESPEALAEEDGADVELSESAVEDVERLELPEEPQPEEPQPEEPQPEEPQEDDLVGTGASKKGAAGRGRKPPKAKGAD